MYNISVHNDKMIGNDVGQRISNCERRNIVRKKLCCKRLLAIGQIAIKGIIIIFRALNQVFLKSNCDTMVLLFGKQLKCAIIDGILWKITFLEYIYDIDH